MALGTEERNEWAAAYDQAHAETQHIPAVPQTPPDQTQNIDMREQHEKRFLPANRKGWAWVAFLFVAIAGVFFLLGSKTHTVFDPASKATDSSQMPIYTPKPSATAAPGSSSSTSSDASNSNSAATNGSSSSSNSSSGSGGALANLPALSGDSSSASSSSSQSQGQRVTDAQHGETCPADTTHPDGDGNCVTGGESAGSK